MSKAQVLAELLEQLARKHGKDRLARARDMGFDTDVYHGTAADFPAFSPSGSNTKARSAKEAVWFTDSPEVAGGYARMAGEDAPVQALIDASMDAERRGDWDLAHDLIAKAERLEGDLIDAGGQNVIPAKIRAGNLYAVDADGATMADLDESQLYSWVKDAKAQGFDGLRIDNFSDNADWGNYTPATHYAIFDPSNIRSVNAAFDPDKKDSANLLASLVPGAVGLGALSASGGADASTGERASINYLAEAMNALDMPMRGYHALAAVLSDLARGQGLESAVSRGAQYARQPIEETARAYGTAVADETGSPYLAALVDAMTQAASPW